MSGSVKTVTRSVRHQYLIESSFFSGTDCVSSHDTLQVATVMIVTDRIAVAAAQIDPSYSPGGANVTLTSIHGFLDPQESVLPNGIAAPRSVQRFCRLTRVLNGQTHRPRNGRL